MRGNWGVDARMYIEDATKELPETASVQERRAALRKVGGLYHMGTSWGKKVWSRECRKYLERHGLDPLAVEDTHQPRLKAALDRGDVIFPYRARS